MNEELLGMEAGDLVILTDDDGNDIEFSFAAVVAYEGSTYVVLRPENEQEQDDYEVFVLTADGEFDCVEEPELAEAVLDSYRRAQKK